MKREPDQPTAPRLRSPARAQPLPDNVRHHVRQLLQDLEGLEPSNLHGWLIQTVEKPLLEEVMARTGHNQSRAAQWLGLNRNTLRKKLLAHGLLHGVEDSQ